MFKTKVKIMEKHISKGIPKNANSCPIALGFFDVGMIIDAETDCFTLLLEDDSFSFGVSSEINNFIERFNKGLPVKSMTIIVDWDKRKAFVQKELEQKDLEQKNFPSLPILQTPARVIGVA